VAAAAKDDAMADGHNDELLRMPSIDIDLDEFADVRDGDELKVSPQHSLDAPIVPSDGHHFRTQNNA
jgi:hypothetical protein